MWVRRGALKRVDGGRRTVGVWGGDGDGWVIGVDDVA